MGSETMLIMALGGVAIFMVFLSLFLFIVAGVACYLVYRLFKENQQLETAFNEVEQSSAMSRDLKVLNAQVYDLHLLLKAVWDMDKYNGDIVIENLRNAIAVTIQKFKEYGDIHGLDIEAEDEAVRKLKRDLVNGEVELNERRRQE